MAKDLKVIIFVGPPAAGKTTTALEMLKRNSDYVRINRDDYRMMLRDERTCDFRVENLITDLCNEAISESLSKKFNVIVDNTNLKEKYLQALIDHVQPLANIEFRIFDISLDKALERDASREKSVGEVVLKKMYKDFKNISDNPIVHTSLKKSARIYTPPVFNTTLPFTYIFDIDGTLAHMNGKRGPFDWRKVDADDPDEVVIDILKFHKEYGHHVTIMSGRDSEAREKTEFWLNYHGVEYDQLFMRAKGDFRKDNIIKKELYDNNILGKFNVKVVYDDRDQVVKMWREELGLKVFQVNPGKF
jgi:predicted kinase